jgi:2-iminobutanoate/2-iminopropanoate deaminase
VTDLRVTTDLTPILGPGNVKIGFLESAEVTAGCRLERFDRGPVRVYNPASPTSPIIRRIFMTVTAPEVIHTTQAPQAIGPYSQAVRVGDFIFTAGQIGLDPQAGQIVEGGIEGQTRQVLKNLTAVLEAAGSGMASVVKTTVYLQNLAEFNQMNAIYAEFFPQTKPARSTVQVAALPRGALVEIDCVAVIGSGS